MSQTYSNSSSSKKVLASEYTWPQCIWQLSYLGFSMFLWYRLIQETIALHQGPLPVVLAFIIAQLFIDFISGVFHWAADTWGKIETPIFGMTVIKNFRTHHLDPQDITLHSFAETCANSSYPAPFVIAIGFLTNSGSFLSQTYNWMIIFGVVLGIMTNQCHKWAHMVHAKPPLVVRFLQKSGLIISHEKHHRHHTGNFDTDYCIINGWMNPILEKIDFWRRAEIAITKLTGYVPREDDAYWRSVKAATEQ